MVKKSEGPYRYCYAYGVDDEKIKRNGHWVRTVRFYKPDLERDGDHVAADEMYCRVDKNGKIKSRAYGLLPIKYTSHEAFEKAKKMAKILLFREMRKQDEGRGCLIQDDDDLKLRVLCPHKAYKKNGLPRAKLGANDQARRKRNLTIGRAKCAINILDRMGLPHPNLDKIVA